MLTWLIKIMLVIVLMPFCMWAALTMLSFACEVLILLLGVIGTVDRNKNNKGD